MTGLYRVLKVFQQGFIGVTCTGLQGNNNRLTTGPDTGGNKHFIWVL